MDEILKEGFGELGLSQDGDALRRFRVYASYLEERGSVMNLTAIKGEEDTARLHFLDCCALLPLWDFAGRRVIDVGTGAGFPGLPLLIREPSMKLTLLDSQKKRVDFLGETLERLDLSAELLCCRAEEAPPALRGTFDCAVSRAVARLSALAELCLPFVKQGGVFIAMKGPDCSEETAEARRAAAVLGGGEPEIRCYTVPGTDIRHAAVIIRKVGETPAKYPRRWAKIVKNPL